MCRRERDGEKRQAQLSSLKCCRGVVPAAVGWGPRCAVCEAERSLIGCAALTTRKVDSMAYAGAAGNGKSGIRGYRGLSKASSIQLWCILWG